MLGQGQVEPGGCGDAVEVEPVGRCQIFCVSNPRGV
jgi:hypothetical protein